MEEGIIERMGVLDRGIAFIRAELTRMQEALYTTQEFLDGIKSMYRCMDCDRMFKVQQGYLPWTSWRADTPVKHCPYCSSDRLMGFPTDEEYLERKGTFLERKESVDEASN